MRFKDLTRRVEILPAERIMFASALALATIDAVLLLYRGPSFDWKGYAGPVLVSLAMIVAGHFYRSSGRSDRIASTFIATGCLGTFTPAASIFTLLMLPIWRAPIDPFLAAIDAAFGFHWPDVMQAVSGSPWLIEASRYAYMSPLYQYAVFMLILGLGGRERDLHLFMVAITIACLMTIGFWSLLPSLGTTSIYALPEELERSIRPILGSQYGAKMLSLAAEGPARIASGDTQGVISSPSFHTVMALLAIHAVRNVRWLLLPFVVLNILVIVGTIIHGAHHLTDVILGTAVTVAAIAVAQALLRREDKRAPAPDLLPSRA